MTATPPDAEMLDWQVGAHHWGLQCQAGWLNLISKASCHTDRLRGPSWLPAGVALWPKEPYSKSHRDSHIPVGLLPQAVHSVLALTWHK